MKESQETIKKIEAEGKSGGDLVKVKLNGDGELISIEIDDDVKAQFEEEVDIFDDEAFNEYVAEGSAVDTETRRTVVAVAAAVTVAAATTRN